ncbi:MAG: imelysin family protein [Hahellaceae bacterium]|nr:imelysin family protein [Hahellaceae bacterium]MCP5212554.1 imelysin family protein [Hahellaceae bacterium]
MKALFLSILTIISIFHGVAQAATFVSAEQQLLQVMTDELTIPAYRDLANKSQVLNDSVVKACHPYKNVDIQQLADLQQQWRLAALQWSATQAYSGGPVAEPFRFWNVQFWPDKKDLVQQKFRPLLQNASERMLTPEELAQKSIALQGLGALEYLLFDQRFIGVNERNERWCNLLMATAFNLQQASTQTYTKWLEDRALWLYYDEEDDPQTQFSSKVGTVFLGVLVALDVTKGRKLGEPLRLQQGKLTENPANIYFFEYWRSGTSIQSIRAMLLALQKLYISEGGLRTFLFAKERQLSDNDAQSSPPDAVALDASIKRGFESALSLSNALLKTSDASEGALVTIANGPERDQLYSLYTNIRELLLLFKSDYTTITGIKVGFNSNDGD